MDSKERSKILAEIRRLGRLARQAENPEVFYRQIDELAERYRLAEGIGFDLEN